MFSTSLTIAVAGFLASNSIPVGTAWQTDYAKAVQASSSANKPMVIVLADGNQNRILETGTLSKEANQLLEDKFVALHVDTTTAAGKKLADSFGLTLGVVISDKDGGHQALRHTGRVSQESLQNYLVRFADSGIATTTEYQGATVPAVQPAVNASTAVAPVQYQQPQFAQPQFVQPQAAPFQYYGGAMAQPFGGFVRSNCPNCR